MDVASSPLAGAFLFAASATLPVAWWALALAGIVFVVLIAKIVSLVDERRKMKAEIALLEGEEEVTAPTPDTEMGGSED